MTNYSATLDQVFYALSDSTRRSVIQRLSRGPASVKELAKPFDMALPSFMQHLKVLERCGLVQSRKVGRVRTCEMASGSLSSAESWLSEQRTTWEGRLDRLDNYLNELQEKNDNDN